MHPSQSHVALSLRKGLKSYPTAELRDREQVCNEAFRFFTPFRMTALPIRGDSSLECDSPMAVVAIFDSVAGLPYHCWRGRARRGASGALYPQSAIAGCNSPLRPNLLGRFPERAALMAGSHAAQACEPRQVREEATVNRSLRVPWESLA